MAFYANHSLVSCLQKQVSLPVVLPNSLQFQALGLEGLVRTFLSEAGAFFSATAAAVMCKRLDCCLKMGLLLRPCLQRILAQNKKFPDCRKRA